MKYQRTELKRVENVQIPSKILDWKLNLFECSKESNAIYVATGNCVYVIDGRMSYFLSPFSVCIVHIEIRNQSN
jgi:hypothetical protein